MTMTWPTLQHLLIDNGVNHWYDEIIFFSVFIFYFYFFKKRKIRLFSDSMFLFPGKITNGLISHAYKLRIYIYMEGGTPFTIPTALFFSPEATSALENSVLFHLFYQDPNIQINFNEIMVFKWKPIMAWGVGGGGERKNPLRDINWESSKTTKSMRLVTLFRLRLDFLFRKKIVKTFIFQSRLDSSNKVLLIWLAAKTEIFLHTKIILRQADLSCVFFLPTVDLGKRR